ncbi:MAG: SWIM zinc finger family protein, partial [Rhodanobacteraceae bacterium]
MDPVQLQPLLSQFEWRSNFSERTLSRGVSYAHRHKVLSLDLEQDEDCNWVLTGEVSGSGGAVYDCRVVIESYDRFLALETHCSCPVGTDCKHAAAMMVAAAQSGSGAAPRQTSPARRRPAWFQALGLPGLSQAPAPKVRAPNAGAPDRWALWLGTLAPVAEPPNQTDAERQFGILLRADERGRLNANPAWLRPGRNKPAKLVDPKPVGIDYQGKLTPSPANGWPRDVEAALRLLLQERFRFDALRGWIRIEQDWQEQALDTLLSHYPAYYRKGDTPLERGPELEPHLIWHGLPDGNQRLALRAGAEGTGTLVSGAGVWYVSQSERRFGRVAGDQRLPALIDAAPELKPEQVNALR